MDTNILAFLDILVNFAADTGPNLMGCARSVRNDQKCALMCALVRTCAQHGTQQWAILMETGYKCCKGANNVHKCVMFLHCFSLKCGPECGPDVVQMCPYLVKKGSSFGAISGHVPDPHPRPISLKLVQKWIRNGSSFDPFVVMGGYGLIMGPKWTSFRCTF